uniref:uncharacterized protein LOC118153027 n=1 Tax=Callithrix jacchus TaxID=9483 RepID=UPI00159DA855|nr:uncharacterized protein LOC118153027 [Callithrix jacchus]
MRRSGRAPATIIHFARITPAHSQNADWTRPRAAVAAARPPRLSLAGPSRAGTKAGARAGAARRRSGARRRGAAGTCTFPPGRCLLANRAFACLFSRLKGTIQRWKTSLTSRQKREKGRRTKLSVGLRGYKEPTEKENI